MVNFWQQALQHCWRDALSHFCRIIWGRTRCFISDFNNHYEIRTKISLAFLLFNLHMNDDNKVGTVLHDQEKKQELSTWSWTKLNFQIRDYPSLITVTTNAKCKLLWGIWQVWESVFNSVVFMWCQKTCCHQPTIRDSNSAEKWKYNLAFTYVPNSLNSTRFALVSFFRLSIIFLELHL